MIYIIKIDNYILESSIPEIWRQFKKKYKEKYDHISISLMSVGSWRFWNRLSRYTCEENKVEWVVCESQ